MLRHVRLFALVLLIASWEVTSEDYDAGFGEPDDDGITYFGCHRNVDALCSGGVEDKRLQELTWAIRLHKKKRDYACHDGHVPQCCQQGLFSAISDSPTHSILKEWKATDNCAHRGQS
ncbi:hypothetical protein Pst134EA_004796 [Puccinia striiformis f. sp. tritici]|uniref:Hydrophobin n=1 Tax=Puccinia striiformis f. sp. tritici PST-78 TaxID=1165861 RepID=A0A0L0VFJ8_9BASI|nr:hypothetical protein Pst134EA_004796 [Puccinia striiformis f. sp. tritici]KAI9613543.1 hypothetical protein H4Q26_010150 [Puccinia striiformis f. sp. tritici PST-130]KNE97956.1 hypothetical protein PSTG_08829 [Puccinia striiformis f. sp. tritici PST-78]KAH9461964.1 hypothetical protein Pst134EB_005880 [Puccinia striiformis f. sp. tritici]KAH9470882.1 hypothetical protein Pst134EA_004796 [Puccinia striiformis f. sp. tritici]KAI9623156.1 hypothetical protein KEM48_009586 [Puccinia striiformis